MENSMTLHFNKLQFLLPKDVLCKVWLKLTINTGEEDFFVVVNAFSLSFALL